VDSVEATEAYHANNRWGAENLVAMYYGMNGDELRELLKAIKEERDADKTKISQPEL